MKTEINEECQKAIDILEDARVQQTLETIRHTIDSAIYVLRQVMTEPEKSNNVAQFISITKAMAKTYAAKNHDYGNSFEQSLDKFGIIASVVRLGDKMNRIEALAKNEAQVKDESVKDTLLDLANYCIMTVMWMNNKLT